MEIILKARLKRQIINTEDVIRARAKYLYLNP